jgi:CDP-diacylglycerol--glycerol-3-phosphate 3-phosphatidyltransferase
MNLPNKLTVLRLILVPFILVVMLLPYTWYNNILAALIFGVASFTDMLDGKIARKHGLVTDFGKFLDPLADKFMVIAAIFGIVCRYRTGNIMFWLFMAMLMITVFRELAVASIRLITAKKSGVVVAADKLGKIKTVVQIVCIELALLEPLLHDLLAHFDPTFFFYGFFALTYLSAVLAIVFTIWSGLNYILSYWKYMDPEK